MQPCTPLPILNHSVFHHSVRTVASTFVISLKFIPYR